MEKSLKTISFPVFPISKTGKIFVEGTRYIYQSASNIKYIIDDTSLSGEFYKRRITLVSNNEKILPLKKAIPSLGQLILFARIYKHFIDSNGKLFIYKRETCVPVYTKRIIGKYPYKNATVLALENCHCPFIFHRQSKPNEIYAIIAYVEKGYILLGLSKTPYLRRERIMI